MFHILGMQRGSGKVFIDDDIRSADLRFFVDMLLEHEYDFFISESEYKVYDGREVLVEDFKIVATFVNGYYAYDSGSKLPEVVIKLLKDGHTLGAPLR